jgi:hypothetical protein
MLEGQLDSMRFKQFQQVAPAKDIPESNLRRGDLATIVDIHPANGGGCVPGCVEIRISVSMSEKFLPQLPYNERSQGSQGFTIPPQAAFKRETCLRSCHPPMRHIRI